MRKINAKGVALFELLTAIPLYVLLSVVLTMSMMHFIVQYNETQDFITLQDDLYSALESIRLGYVNKKMAKMPLMGVASADSVFIGNDGSLFVAPTDYDPIRSEYSQFKFSTGTGELLVSGRNYDRSNNAAIPANFRNQRVFPLKDDKIGNKYKFQLTKFDVKNATPNLANTGSKIWLLEVYLEAEVRFRKKDRGQSIKEDKEQNIRTISYTTKIFLGNVEKAF